MRSLVFAVVLILLPIFLFAEGLKISLKIESGANQKVKLANYFLGNIYIRDSLVLDAGGSGVFSRDTLLPQGLYKIYLDDKNHFDFLLGADQDFSITKSSFSAQETKVKGAVETEKFVEYSVFLKNIQEKGAGLNKKLAAAAQDDKQAIKNELDSLTNSLHNYWLQTKKDYPNSMLAIFLMANYIETPDIKSFPEEVQNNDSLLLFAKFNFQKKHYWDNFDYTDERLLYTPFYKTKLETWFNKILYQNYDSVKAPVLAFIEEVKPHKRIFQFAASWFLNAAINSDVMGMDALFVDIAKTYYFTGQAFWTTEESMKKIRENVMFAEHNLIGMKAPDLLLETFDGEYKSIYKTDAPVMVVIIFEPGCSHCREFVPKFHDQVYEKYKDKGLKVYAIYSMDKRDEWEKFLMDHHLFDWINVWDEKYITQFKVLYDARKTPAIYVLDKDKKIIAKSMSPEQMDNLFKELLH